MQFSYVLPDPASYDDWGEFEGDLACIKQSGYDAVELQVPDPTALDAVRVRQALRNVGLPLCAVQTGGTYASRGNCLSTTDAAVRRRTVALLRSFVDFAAEWRVVLVFGSLQGRLTDEPDRAAGAQRIREALREVGQYASEKGAVLAFEPVNHLEVGWHNTIAEAVQLVRGLNLPAVRLMVDTFHMNIEERDMLAPLAGLRDLLAHVHLCETNRDVLGTGHWPTAKFLRELGRIGYTGHCSVGVYNTSRPTRECLVQCMAELRQNGKDEG